MDKTQLQTIRNGLKDYMPTEVGIYLNYLKELSTATDRNGKIKNPWMSQLTDIKAINYFKKVAKDKGLFIDGTTITFTYRGIFIITYNYQAYKNKLLIIYPETLFDIQNVHEGDKFAFQKNDGHVTYSHSILNPFELNKKIIGTYCIIKNKRGEFIETLNMDDITKMKNVAKTLYIWNSWEGEMILKSVIKRACKRHFNDIVTNIEVIDSENYEPETVNIDSKIKEQINNCDNLDDLQLLYDIRKDEVKDEKTFLLLIDSRKKELKS